MRWKITWTRSSVTLTRTAVLPQASGIEIWQRTIERSGWASLRKIPRWTPGWSPSPPTPRCRCWPARSSPLRCSNSPLECSPRLASCAAWWTEWCSHIFSLFLPVDGDFHHWFPSEAASFCAGVSSLNTSNTSDRFGLLFWYKSTLCDLVDWSGKKNILQSYH